MVSDKEKTEVDKFMIDFKIQQIFDALPYNVMLINSDKKILFANKALKEYSKFEKRALL